MGTKIKRSGSPRSGSYRDFIDWFCRLEVSLRDNVYVSSTKGGEFNFAVFPSPLDGFPSETQRLIDIAKSVTSIEENRHE